MQEQGFNRSIPCLCCNKVVLIRSVDWTDECVGLCVTCYKAHSNDSIRLIHFLRCQIAALASQIAQVQGDITKLFTTAKELEDAVFEAVPG